MARGHLAIHTREAPSFDLFHQRDQPDFRRIGHSTEHRLAEKHPAKAHAIQTADQLPPQPDFDGVRTPDVEQTLVCVRHLIRDPRPVLTASRLRATPHDLPEAVVERDLHPAGADRLAQ